MPVQQQRSRRLMAVLSSVLECQSRASTGQPLRYQTSQSVRRSTGIEQALSYKVDEGLEFVFGKLRIPTEPGVQPVQHRLEWTHRTLQIRRQQRRVVRSGGIGRRQVVPNRVFQADERTVVHERGL
jgi:hypothetical protein